MLACIERFVVLFDEKLLAILDVQAGGQFAAHLASRQVEGSVGGRHGGCNGVDARHTAKVQSQSLTASCSGFESRLVGSKRGVGCIVEWREYSIVALLVKDVVVAIGEFLGGVAAAHELVVAAVGSLGAHIGIDVAGCSLAHNGTLASSQCAVEWRKRYLRVVAVDGNVGSGIAAEGDRVAGTESSHIVNV